ncbi:MAG: heavy metal-binding domain-containing protein [Saprospiraceae bacterium]
MKYFKMIFLGLALTAFLASCGGTEAHKHDGHDHDAMHSETTENSDMEKQGKEYTSAYVCPMHCEGSGSDKPGNCPKCGMEYVVNEDHQH